MNAGVIWFQKRVVEGHFSAARQLLMMLLGEPKLNEAISAQETPVNRYWAVESAQVYGWFDSARKYGCGSMRLGQGTSILAFSERCD